MNGRIAAVVGWPVAQSLSPVIHRHWFREYGIDGDYVALPVAPENFSRCITALPLMGFAGVNVTVPHKQSAAALAETLDEDARITGAVNLLVFGDHGIDGANTDVQGFLASLRETLPVDEIGNRPAVVLGAGGAARAIVLALDRAGFAGIRIVNRTRERAEAIASALALRTSCQVLEWGDWPNAFDNAGVLVNTTSLGMKGKAALELPLHHLPSDAAVADIVYNPVQTELLRQAAAAGHATMDGLGMLMHQAVPAFAAWFGVTPKVTAELRTKLLQVLARA
ncbi:MAG: shikimate dehydrogenase [Alphaproteobacteria bacterium]|nr:shikimate dehydrogenase [Alphaproteobacteria bacterium]